jgi:hypothetical protein
MKWENLSKLLDMVQEEMKIFGYFEGVSKKSSVTLSFDLKKKEYFNSQQKTSWMFQNKLHGLFR